MSKSLRRTEKLFRAGLWVVAFFFGSFLLELGGLIISDLPKVEQSLSLDNFVEPKAKAALEGQLEAAKAAETKAREEEERQRLELIDAQNKLLAAQEAYNNWLTAKGRPTAGEVDRDAITLLAHVENLRGIESIFKAKVNDAEKVAFEARTSLQKTQDSLDLLRQSAQSEYQQALRAQELRVFLYRLALVLPLVIAAVWLFRKKRQSNYWPFVWGFIGFATLAFFSEVVPYLPSYGGYVHTLIAIVISIVVGQQAVLAMNRYLEKQKQLETQPEAERRQQLDHEKTLIQLSKSVCPGCERKVDLTDTKRDFCEHCGLGLFNTCHTCSTRKSAFAKYCQGCGTATN